MRRIKVLIMSLLIITLFIPANVFAAPDRAGEGGNLTNEDIKSMFAKPEFLNVTKIIFSNEQIPEDMKSKGIKLSNYDGMYWTNEIYGYINGDTLYFQPNFISYDDGGEGIFFTGKDLSGLFSGLSKIEYIDLRGVNGFWNIYDNYDISNLFAGCNNLKTIQIGHSIFYNWGEVADVTMNNVTQFDYQDQNGVIYTAGSFPIDNTEPLTLKRVISDPDHVIITELSQEKTISIPARLHIDSKYTVLIPKTVDVSNTESSFEIKAKGTIADNESLDVKLPQTIELSNISSNEKIPLTIDDGEGISFTNADLNRDDYTGSGATKTVKITHETLGSGEWSTDMTVELRLKSPIKFTIDGTTYYADEGMTWEQWINSEYNTVSARIESTGTIYYDGYRIKLSNVIVTKNDIIIGNTQYIHNDGSGGSSFID